MKTKSHRRPREGSAAPSASRASANSDEVLTFAEAARYLRGTEQDLLRLIREQGPADGSATTGGF